MAGLGAEPAVDAIEEQPILDVLSRVVRIGDIDCFIDDVTVPQVLGKARIVFLQSERAAKFDAVNAQVDAIISTLPLQAVLDHFAANEARIRNGVVR